MLEVVGSRAHFIKVLDTVSGKEELYTAHDLINFLAQGVAIEGCKYSKNGVSVSYGGNKPVEFEAEVWKPITLVDKKRPDGRYVYEVSNLARIRASHFFGADGKCRPPKILHPTINRYNWCRMRFSIDRKFVVYDVHELVARAFLPGYMPDSLAIHIDGNSEDCSVYNLKWVKIDEYATERQKRRRSISILGKPVRQYDLFGNIVAEYPSIMAASRCLGIDSAKSGISLCCSKPANCMTYKGFIWRFAEKDELYGVDDPVAAGILRVVRQYTLDGNFIAEYSALKEIRQKLGINTNTIPRCGRGGLKSTAGFTWRYSDNDELANRPENIAARAEWRAKQNA